MFFGLRLVDWMFCSLEVATTFLLFHILVPFPLLFFQKFFLLFSRNFNGLFLLRALGGFVARVSLVGGLN